MTRWFGWLRAKGWDIYNVAERIKSDGDAAWLDGDFDIAAYKYGQATHFWDAAVFHSQRDIKGLDEQLNNAQWHLDTICSIDQILAYIHAGQSAEGGDAASAKRWIEYPRMVNVPTSLKALKVYACGIDAMLQNKPTLAASFFRSALTLCLPEDEAMYRQALVMAMGFGVSTSSERKSDLAILKATLPQKPLASPVVQPYVCDLAASERWICTTLGLSSLPEDAERIIQEGVSIRLVEGVNKPGEILGLFPTEGPDSYTISDLDMLEVLLHRRLVSFWSGIPASRRGTSPRLCQIGHVHPDVLNNAVTESAKMNRNVKVPVIGKMEAWITAPVTHVGMKYLSQDLEMCKVLLDAWDARRAGEKRKV